MYVDIKNSNPPRKDSILVKNKTFQIVQPLLILNK